MPERQNAINAFLADNGWQPEHRTVLAEDASLVEQKHVDTETKETTNNSEEKEEKGE